MLVRKAGQEAQAHRAAANNKIDQLIGRVDQAISAAASLYLKSIPLGFYAAGDRNLPVSARNASSSSISRSSNCCAPCSSTSRVLLSIVLTCR